MIGSLFADLAAELRPCSCPVCSRHDEAHLQVRAVLLGPEARVDAELAPLLHALAVAGVLTVSSCVDLAEAVERIQPAMLPGILARRGEPGLHYGDVIARRWAFVRVLDTPAAAPFLEAVDRLGGEVVPSGIVAQAAFPRDRLQRLTWALGDVEHRRVPELLTDQWPDRDLRVLLAVATELEREPWQSLKPEAIAEATGLSHQDVARALVALDPTYISVNWIKGMHEPWGIVHEITDEGRRAVGLWPSPEAGVERLLAALDKMIEQTQNEDERGRWQKFRDHVAANGAQVGWSLVTAVLTGQLPGQ